MLRRAGYGVTAADNAAAADYILLPMSQGRVSDEVARALQGAGQGTLILAGRPGMPVRMAAREAGLPLIDYFLRPELECLNAVPTAEGCLELLLRLRERTIWESGFLVLGYGRVGRAVARRLVLLKKSYIRETGWQANWDSVRSYVFCSFSEDSPLLKR